MFLWMGGGTDRFHPTPVRLSMRWHVQEYVSISYVIRNTYSICVKRPLQE